MAIPTFTPVNTISQGDIQGAQGTYNRDTQQSQDVLANLQNFQKNMQSGTDMYSQQVQAGNAAEGFDPTRLQQSLGNVAQTQKVIAGLPQAIQAQNAGTGATAANLAGSTAAQAGNLNTELAQQGANVQQNQATQQAALTYAQQGTAAGQQGQALQLQGYQTQYQSAQAQLATAQTQLQSLNQIYAQNQQFNADQARQYAQLQYQAQQAQASMMTAQAAITSANSNAALQGLQGQQLQQQIANTNAAIAANQASPSTHTPDQPYNAAAGVTSTDFIQPKKQGLQVEAY